MRVLILAITGCTGAAAEPTKLTLADVGLEAASLDRTVDPCVDFYQFACGGWLQAAQIPADRGRWGRGSELDDRNTAAIKTLLQESAAGTKLGDFYASCLDDAGIERAGTTALKPLLAKTTGVKDAATWLAALTELHKARVPAVWSVHAVPDLKDATTFVTTLDVAGGEVPDKQSVAKLLAPVAPAAKADDVVAIETELGKLARTAAEKRDVAGAYNPTDQKNLAKQLKIDWKAYWKAMAFDPSARIVLATPRVAALDKLRTRFKPPQWSAYFTYKLVATYAFALPKAFDGQRKCVDATRDALGELLGQQYTARFFPAAAKQTAVTEVDALVKALVDTVGGLDWMTPATKQVATAKLGKLVRMVGYPDKWRVYDFDVKRDDFAGNALRAAAFDARRDLARSGKPVDRADWQMDTYAVNAFYTASANSAVLPAGILQAPFFSGSPERVAANLGGIGMVFGHELTHAIDEQGGQFDADGNLKPWWQKEDRAAFAQRTQCIADAYSQLEAMPKAFINGKLTAAEDVADIGGVTIAFRAYRALHKDPPKLADGFTEDQQFFIAVGQAWCAKDKPEELARRLAGDPHAPPKFRVYGALRNLKEFADAFQCPAGTPMHPAKVCTIW